MLSRSFGAADSGASSSTHDCAMMAAIGTQGLLPTGSSVSASACAAWMMAGVLVQTEVIGG